MNEKVVNTLNHYTKNIIDCTIDLLSIMDRHTSEYKMLRRWFTDYVHAFGTIFICNSIVPLTLTLNYYFDHVFPKIANKDDEDRHILAMSIKDDLGYMHREFEDHLNQL